MGGELAVSSVGDDLALFLELQVLSAVKIGETPLAGNVDGLTAGELELGAAEGLNGMRDVLLNGAHRHDNVTNVNASDDTIGLTVGTTHTGLETIRTGAGKHLVDAEHVEGVGTHAQMETILTADLGGVLVGGHTGSLQSFRGQVLVFLGHHVDGEGELVDGRLLLTTVVDAQLGVGDTTVEARLGERLVLDETVAIYHDTTSKHSYVSTSPHHDQ